VALVRITVTWGANVKYGDCRAWSGQILWVEDGTWLFWLYWGLNSGPVLPREVIYHLNHSISPFCVGCFQDRVLLSFPTCLDHDLPSFASWHSWEWQVCPIAPSRLVEMGSCELFTLLPSDPWATMPALNLCFSLTNQVFSVGQPSLIAIAVKWSVVSSESHD
jgi:hypothetical protein